MGDSWSSVSVSLRRFDDVDQLFNRRLRPRDDEAVRCVVRDDPNSGQPDEGEGISQFASPSIGERDHLDGHCLNRFAGSRGWYWLRLSDERNDKYGENNCEPKQPHGTPRLGCCRESSRTELWAET